MSTTSIKKAAIINFAGKYTNIFIPVSYTHLDVYKRQGFNNNQIDDRVRD